MNVRLLVALALLLVAKASTQAAPLGTILNENFSSYQVGGIGGQIASNGNTWAAKTNGYIAGGPVVDRWRGINMSVGGIGAVDALYGADLLIAAATEGTLTMKADFYQSASNQSTRFVRLQYQDLSGGEISIRRSGNSLIVDGASIGIPGATIPIGATPAGQEEGWVHTELRLSVDGSASSLYWDIGSSNGTVNFGAYTNPHGLFSPDNLFMYYQQSNSAQFMVDNISIENASTTTVGGALDYMNYQNGWHTQSIGGTKYKAITADRNLNYTIYAARTGGLDEMTYSGGWNVHSINNQTYGAVAADGTGSSELYGARTGGGLDYAYYQGGWQTQQIGSANYISLAPAANKRNNLVGAKVGGGLDNIYYQSGWHIDSINSQSYSQVISDRATTGEEYYGAQADGGLDYIYFQAGQWHTDSLSNGTYISITPDFSRHYNFFAAREGGGLDNIAFYSGAWHVDPVNSKQYVSITVNEGVAGQEIFGARADGGVDNIFFQNGWQTTLVNSSSYSQLVGDRGTGQYEFYGILADAPPLPGDYNGDGKVDTGDYVLWRKGVQPLPHNETATVGTTDAQDYLVWRSHFGNSQPGNGRVAAVAVPEPPYLMLLFVTAPAIIVWRGRYPISRFASLLALVITVAVGNRADAVDGNFTTIPVTYYNPATLQTTTFFPIVWYGSYSIFTEDNYGWLNRVAGNTVAVTFDPNDASFNALGGLLNQAVNLNKKVLITFSNEFVDGVNTTQLSRFVNLAKTNPATLGYILGDEMNGHAETSASEAVSSASVIAGLDPNRQIWQVFGGRVNSSATPYLSGTKVVSNDNYTYQGLPVGAPIPAFKDTTQLYEHNARSGLYAFSNNKSYVHFTQAFGFDAASPNNYQLPSEPEYRHNVFSALASAGSRGIVDWLYAPPAYGDPFGVFFPWETQVLNPVNAELGKISHAMEAGYRVGNVGLTWTHTSEDSAHSGSLAWNMMSQLLVYDNLASKYYLIVTNNGFDSRSATIDVSSVPASLASLTAFVARTHEFFNMQSLGGGAYRLNDTLSGHEVAIYELSAQPSAGSGASIDTPEPACGALLLLASLFATTVRWERRLL